MHTIFFDLTLIFILASVAAFITSFLKQPTIIAYIATGIIIGPMGFHRLQDGDVLQGLSELGITLLLFMIGLELDISGLKRMGKIALLAGLGQIIFTALAGFTLIYFLGFDIVPAWYIALALTFSSGIIAVKLLNEKKDMQSLYGKLAIGILLMQDMAIMITLISLSSINSGDGSVPAWEHIFFTIIKTGVLAVIVIWNSLKVFPRILKYIGKSDELLLVFALAWALGFSAFASLPFIGLNLEVGGFLAGIALANTAVHYQISSRIKSLRDFFLILFLISLGSQLVLTDISHLTFPIIALSVLVLVGNPLIIVFVLGILGYKPRTSLMTGLTLAQVSEFSLIIMGLGYKLGHLNQSHVSLVIMVAVISMIISSYMVRHAQVIHRTLQPVLAWFDFRKGKAEKSLRDVHLTNHIILVGAHRLGAHLINVLAKKREDFVIVDHNPEIVEQFEKQGWMAICGDIADSYIQDLANIEKAKLVISTVPDIHDNLTLIESIQLKNPKAKLIFTAQDEAEALLLYGKKIDYALLPLFVGGNHLAKILQDKNGIASLKKLKTDHLKTLQT